MRPARPSRTARLAEFFRARPGEWQDGRAIAAIAGTYAWRTRISDVRREFGLEIENRLRRVQTEHGETVTVSEYRWPGARADRESKQNGPSDAASVHPGLRL